MPSLALATGVGVGKPLHDIMEQLFLEEQSRQRQGAEARTATESERSHRAEEGLRGQQLQMEGETNALQRARQATQDTETRQRDANSEASVLGNQIPPDTELSPSDPAVKTMQSGGRSSLLKLVPASMASTSMTGAGGQPTAANPTGVDMGKMKLTPIAAKGEYMKKLPSFDQQDKLTDNARQAQGSPKNWQRNKMLVDGELTDVLENPIPTSDGKRQVIAVSGKANGQDVSDRAQSYTAPQQVQTTDAGGAPITKFATPKAGDEYAARPTASVQDKERSKADAMKTLNYLDEDINTIGAKLGPIGGRISDLEQQFGNADPYISRLAARLTAAKMLVDAGIGGMRGAASPGLMARWDKVMALPLNPQNLHETVQVMREMLGGDHISGPATGQPQTPSTTATGFRVVGSRPAP